MFPTAYMSVQPSASCRRNLQPLQGQRWGRASSQTAAECFAQALYPSLADSAALSEPIRETQVIINY